LIARAGSAFPPFYLEGNLSKTSRNINPQDGGVLIFVCLALAACTPAAPTAITPRLRQRPECYTDEHLAAIQERTPYPYTTPLPPATASAIDGTYVKTEEIVGTPVHCLRCPDYASDGGLWLLRLDKGIYRIHSKLTGWRSIGSYTVSADRLTLFNDGYCGNEVGTYTWSIEQRKLILREIKDDCSFRLRAKNMTLLPWASCQPPNLEAAISDHWQIPEGCRQ
jgi:hypothetical protein